MAEDHIYRLRYEGESISEGLDPVMFAEALKGLTEFLTRVSDSIYGDSEPSTLKVHRLSEGSLILEVVQKLGEASANDLLAISASVSIEINQIFTLLKHLRGTPPKSITKTENRQISVENNHGNIMMFENSTVHLVLNGDIGSSVDKFTQPVVNGKATGYVLEVDQEPSATVESKDAKSMVSVASEQHLLESENEMWLSIQKVVLEGNSKWAFSDGKRTFSATIEDQQFLEKVKDGKERFGNGDRLLVRMKTDQYQRGINLQTRYEILEVLDHQRRTESVQPSLF